MLCVARPASCPRGTGARRARARRWAIRRRPALALDVAHAVRRAASRVAAVPARPRRSAYRRDAQRANVAFADRAAARRAPPACRHRVHRAGADRRRSAARSATRGVASDRSTATHGRATRAIAVWFRPPAGSERGRARSDARRSSRGRRSSGPAWVGALDVLARCSGAPCPPRPRRSACSLAASARARCPRRALGAGARRARRLATHARAGRSSRRRFTSPDERTHFAYVQLLAETGEPRERSRRAAGAVVELDGRSGCSAGRARSPPTSGVDGRPPWLARDERALGAARPRAPVAQATAAGRRRPPRHRPVLYGVDDGALPRAPAVRRSGRSSRSCGSVAGLLGALTVAVRAARRARASSPRAAAVRRSAPRCSSRSHPMFAFIGRVGEQRRRASTRRPRCCLFLVLRAARRGLRSALASSRLGVALGVLPVDQEHELAALYAVAASRCSRCWRSRRPQDGWLRRRGGGRGRGRRARSPLGSARAPASDRPTFTAPGGGGAIAARRAACWTRPGSRSATCGRSSCRGCRRCTTTSRSPTGPRTRIYVVRGWGSFGWYAIDFPAHVVPASSSPARSSTLAAARRAPGVAATG